MVGNCAFCQLFLEDSWLGIPFEQIHFGCCDTLPTKFENKKNKKYSNPKNGWKLLANNPRRVYIPEFFQSNWHLQVVIRPFCIVLIAPTSDLTVPNCWLRWSENVSVRAIIFTVYHLIENVEIESSIFGFIFGVESINKLFIVFWACNPKICCNLQN
jgi:hypothetical protein